MEWKVNIFSIHPIHQQAYRLGHQQRIGSFHGYHNIGKPFLHSDAQIFHARFHHSFGGIAIARHDTIGERSVVHADAYGCTMFFADLKKGNYFGTDFIQFCRILFLGILQLGKGLLLVDIITGIDAHLLGDGRRHLGCTRIEMDVSRQRDCIALLPQLPVNLPQIVCFAHSLRGQANQIGTGSDDAFTLGHAGFRVERIGVGHRLYHNRVIATHHDVSDKDVNGGAAFIIKKIHISVDYLLKGNTSIQYPSGSMIK